MVLCGGFVHCVVGAAGWQVLYSQWLCFWDISGAEDSLEELAGFCW